MKGVVFMKRFPACKAQLFFEDIMTELINIMSEMEEPEVIEIFEYAQKLIRKKIKR